MTRSTDTINTFEDLALHTLDGLFLAADFIKSIAEDDRVPADLREGAAVAAAILAIGGEDIAQKGFVLNLAETQREEADAA
jgi:hypothetical protein